MAEKAEEKEEKKTPKWTGVGASRLRFFDEKGRRDVLPSNSIIVAWLEAEPSP